MTNSSIDNVIFNIEDYVGGNIEGIKNVDHMAFTVFLRNQLTQSQQELIEKIEGSLPAEYIIENQAHKSHDDLTYESGWKDGQTKTLSEVTTMLKQLKERL